MLRDNAMSTPSPQQFFSGHSEFFCIFIKSVDSFSFGVHLQKRLVHLILTLSSSNETRGLEQRISELQLLSKFLGMLTFSPNWNVPAEDVSYLTSYFTPIIPINTIIEEGYKEGKLVLVVPWALSFLHMMSWDKISKRLSYYRETFSILRSIHKSFTSPIYEGYSPLATNLLSIGLQLDTFFADVIGLAEVERFCDYKLSGPIVRDHMALDTTPFKFSKQFVLSSSTHLDDLHKLTTDLSRDGGLIGVSGASKKLKPYSLSATPTSGLLGAGTITRERFESLDPLDQGKLQDFLSQRPAIEKGQSPGKLVDAFFHQHKHLQQLCEFVIDFSIEHVLSKRCLEECIAPNVASIFARRVPEDSVPSPVDLDWYLHTLQCIEKEATLVVHHYAQKVLQDYIIAAMNTLIPSYVGAAVKDMATTLSINHAWRKGEVLTVSLVRTEGKRVIDSHLHPKKKESKGSKSEGMYSKMESFNNVLIHDIEELTSRFSDIFASSTVGSDQFLLSSEDIGKMHAITTQLKIYVDKGLIFDAVTIGGGSSLVRTLSRVIATWVSTTDTGVTSYPPGFSETLHLASRIGRIGFASDDLASLGRLICDPVTLRRIVHWHHHFNVERFRDDCIEGKLMKKTDLLNGLFDMLERHALSQDAAALSIILVELLRKAKD